MSLSDSRRQHDNAQSLPPRTHDIVDVDNSPVLGAMLRHLSLNSPDLHPAQNFDASSDVSTADDISLANGGNRALFKESFDKAFAADYDLDGLYNDDYDPHSVAFDMVGDDADPHLTADSSSFRTRQRSFDLCIVPQEEAFQPVFKQAVKVTEPTIQNMSVPGASSQTFSASLAATLFSYEARWHETRGSPRSQELAHEWNSFVPSASSTLILDGNDKFSTEGMEIDDDFALPPPALSLDDTRSSSGCMEGNLGGAVIDDASVTPASAPSFDFSCSSFTHYGGVT